MAGEMHVMRSRPSCFVDGWPADAASLPPRVEWAWDCGRACADAKDADSRERQLAHTAGCLGCLRRQCAMMIEDGTLKALEPRGPKKLTGADLCTAVLEALHA